MRRLIYSLAKMCVILYKKNNVASLEQESRFLFKIVFWKPHRQLLYLHHSCFNSKPTISSHKIIWDCITKKFCTFLNYSLCFIIFEQKAEENQYQNAVWKYITNVFISPLIVYIHVIFHGCQTMYLIFWPSHFVSVWPAIHVWSRTSNRFPTFKSIRMLQN